MYPHSKLKAQSAIEYLMTYGWMLLVVAIVGGAIFSMVGDQSIENVSGFNSNEVSVNEFGMASSGLQINIEAAGADSAILKEVKLEDSDRDVNIPLNEDIKPGSNVVLNLPIFKTAEGSNSANIELIYDTGGLENISTKGQVTGGLELDNSLMGYWTLGQDQSNETHVFDISGNNNHGLIENTKFLEDERLGSTTEFNADGSILVRDRENLRIGTQDFTLHAWVNARNTTATHSDTVFSKGKTNSDEVLLYHSRNKLRFYGDNGAFDLGKNTETIGTGWFHVTVVRDGDNGYLYIDGELDDETTGVDDVDLNSVKDISIGSAEEGNDRYLNGTMTHVGFYNRALSMEEIEASYKKPGLIQ